MYKKYIKRIFDILLALLGMPILELIVFIFAPIIYFTDKGPIFYNAPRLGLHGKIFKMFKLRSMYVNSQDVRLEDGSTYNAVNDPRVTPIGCILRKTSLDEIPQIINVLIGDMSFVGPRPDLPDTINIYQGCEINKLNVRQGITGLNQVKNRNSSNLRERFKLDLYYVEHISLMLDIKILFQTIFNVIYQKSIYRKSDSEQTKT